MLVTYAHAQYVIGKCALYVGLTLLTIVYAHINIIYYNRQGSMCSQCHAGYGPAVYAFSLMCAKCSNNGTVYHVLTLLLMTMFYIIVVMFNIRITFPPLTGFVFMCQTYNFIETLYVDLDMKIEIVNHAGSNERFLKVLAQAVRILCGFWNLDFFRFVIPPFCVSSHLSNM